MQTEGLSCCPRLCPTSDDIIIIIIITRTFWADAPAPAEARGGAGRIGKSTKFKTTDQPQVPQGGSGWMDHV